MGHCTTNLSTAYRKIRADSDNEVTLANDSMYSIRGVGIPIICDAGKHTSQVLGWYQHTRIKMMAITTGTHVAGPFMMSTSAHGTCSSRDLSRRRKIGARPRCHTQNAVLFATDNGVVSQLCFTTRARGIHRPCIACRARLPPSASAAFLRLSASPVVVK